MVKRLLLVALVVLSLTGVAYGWGVFGVTGNVASSGGAGGTGSWAEDWNEESQEGLTGFDYCVFFDSSVGSSNETGYSATGAYSGASLVATQNGAISGSTDGETRKTDGVGDYFTINDGTVEGIASGSGASNWFFAWKVKSMLHPASQNSMFKLTSDAGAGTYLQVNVEAGGQLHFVAVNEGVNLFNSTTDDSIASGSDDTTYICYWYDGTSIRGGFMTGTTRPNNWTDFDSDSAVSKATTWDSDNFNNESIIVSQATSGVTANWYFFCATSSTVINN